MTKPQHSVINVNQESTLQQGASIALIVSHAPVHMVAQGFSVRKIPSRSVCIAIRDTIWITTIPRMNTARSARPVHTPIWMQMYSALVIPARLVNHPTEHRPLQAVRQTRAIVRVAFQQREMNVRRILVLYVTKLLVATMGILTMIPQGNVTRTCVCVLVVRLKPAPTVQFQGPMYAKRANRATSSMPLKKHVSIPVNMVSTRTEVVPEHRLAP